MAASSSLRDSSGNQHIDVPLRMKVPHLDFIYRLSCNMAEDNHLVGASFGASHSRVIMPIVDGDVKGPKISAKIERNSGADWSMTIQGTDVSLHALYLEEMLTLNSS